MQTESSGLSLVVSAAGGRRRTEGRTGEKVRRQGPAAEGVVSATTSPTSAGLDARTATTALRGHSRYLAHRAIGGPNSSKTLKTAASTAELKLSPVETLKVAEKALSYACPYAATHTGTRHVKSRSLTNAKAAATCPVRGVPRSLGCSNAASVRDSPAVVPSNLISNFKRKDADKIVGPTVSLVRV